MQQTSLSRVTLEQALAAHGLRVLGGLIPDARDALPVMANGGAAAENTVGG